MLYYIQKNYETENGRSKNDIFPDTWGKSNSTIF